MVLTKGQEEGLKIALERYKNEEKFVTIAGYAGTGKSTLVRVLIQALADIGIDPEQDVCYCAYTGKACQVLSKMGNKPTSTLHRLMFEYRPKITGGFIRIPRPVIDYRIIVVDECSMLPQEFVDMLLSYPVFVIFLGDPFQLPPIEKDKGNYLLNNPHVFLSEIMRQENGNDIIDLTMKIREGKYIEPFNGTNAKVFRKAELTTGMLEWADIVLCATNARRISLNNQMRELKGFIGPPQSGEKVICLQNNWERFSENNMEPLVNGLVGHIDNVYTSFNPMPQFIHGNVDSIDTVVGKFVSETGEEFGELTLDRKQFEKGEETLDWKTKYKLGKSKYKYLIPEQFAYGYAITCHKSQGSQWDNVLVIEEGFPRETEEHARWLYTACTRSSSKLVLIRNI